MVALKNNMEGPKINLSKSGKDWKIDTNINGKQLNIVVETEHEISEIKVKMS